MIAPIAGTKNINLPLSKQLGHSPMLQKYTAPKWQLMDVRPDRQCIIMLYIMKYDLLTGAFTIVPLAVIDKRPGWTVKGMLRNWRLVFCGNLGGVLTTAFFASFILTYGYQIDGGAVAVKVSTIGEARTLGFKEQDILGWFTIFIRGMLCNCMVSMGVLDDYGW